MPSTSRVYTVGQVLTAAQMNDLPQGVLGKAALTAAVGPTSGTTELDVITAPAVTIAGTNRRIRIRFHSSQIAATVASDGYVTRIKEGATELAQGNFSAPGTGAQSIGVDIEAIVDSPTAGSHTYKATVQRLSGTGTATIGATATAPITFTVEDVGIV